MNEEEIAINQVINVLDSLGAVSLQDAYKELCADYRLAIKKIEELEDAKLERDALWVKTQEDERIINELNDAVKEKKRQRDEAIRIANGLLRLTDHLTSYDSSKDTLEEELEKLKLEVY
jgi:uncharacterized coiled-coil protein SlyX